MIKKSTLAGASVALCALVAAGALPSSGQPTPAPQSPGLARPVGPRPSAVPTLPPAASQSALPYPAYGTPAPGVDRGVPLTGIPQTLTLDQAIAIAVARSPLLAAARADIGVAHANTLLQKTQRLPNLAGSVSATRSHRQSTGSSSLGATTITGSTATGGTTPVPAATGSTTTGGNGSAGGSILATDATSVALGVTLRQLIFDGGRVAAQIRAATLNETSFANTYRRQLQTVAYNVAVAYYNQLAAARTTAVDLEVVRLDQVQENLVTAQFRAGTAARTDISTAQLPTAQARLAVVRSQASELSAVASFANAMGLEANTAVVPLDDTPSFQSALTSPLSVPSYTTAIARAYSLRPDLAAQQNSIESARSSLRAAKLGTFPSLQGTASQSTASTDANAGTFRNNGSIGVALSIPIFDQGITAANTVQAQANLDRATANFEVQTQAVQLAVKQALVNLVSARAALDQAQAEFAKASEVLRATQAQYRAGVTTLPLLLNAQVGVTQALTDQVTSVYTLRQAEQQLLYATGSNA